MDLLAAAVAAGATLVRIGFEDSRYMGEGGIAAYNYQEVQYLTELIRKMELEPATPEEAREIMGIHSSQIPKML